MEISVFSRAFSEKATDSRCPDNQRNVQFFGVEMEPINTPDVAIANSELRGAAIDTTNFFGISLSREEHRT